MGIEQGKTRAHGQTAAEEEAKEQSADLDKPLDIDDEEPINLTRAFRRMRTDWHSKDRAIIDQIQADVDQLLWDQFSDAFAIQYKIHDLVREKVIDRSTGEIEVDADGLPKWKRNADGSYNEDWSMITGKQRENLLYEIITRMFDWEQRAADAWGMALIAKAMLNEAFATGFDTMTEKATVDARNAKANRLSADQHYLAVYKSFYSKKAEALVRSMDRLCQRLKDLHV